MAILKIRDAEGNEQEILAIKGDKGDSYVLTDADKQEIAQMAAELVVDNIPSAEEVKY
jgi:dihydrodipicolinate synthase/N-acetylneuraminate lyase